MTDPQTPRDLIVGAAARHQAARDAAAAVSVEIAERKAREAEAAAAARAAQETGP
jgi:hypothetical protein